MFVINVLILSPYKFLRRKLIKQQCIQTILRDEKKKHEREKDLYHLMKNKTNIITVKSK